MFSRSSPQRARAHPFWIRAALALWLASIAGLAGCATGRTEIHLAPLFTEVSVAGGDSEVEALGGAVLTRRDPLGRMNYWALRPLVSWRRIDEARSFSWFLPPFGTRRSSHQEKVTQLLPIFRYSYQSRPEGTDTWDFFSLPGIFWAKTKSGDTRRAVFPFGGVLEHFFSYDRIDFAAFPLFLRTQRHGRTAYHFLWPFFTWANGAGGNSWRVWPLATRNRWEGRYDRWSVLWPFFQYQRNDLNKPERFHQRVLNLWPFFGRSSREGSRSTTALWPFFGYTSDDNTGFWAWDGPWPLVLFQGGDPNRAVRRRVWPFYSYYKGDGLTSRYFLWPFINVRDEVYPDGEKHTGYVFPFWHGWQRTRREDGLTSTWRKFWPIFRSYNDQVRDEELLAFPAFNPLWRLQFVDEHYTWMWELWTQERRFDQLRQRSWAGLWRREKDRDEDRRSLSGLWASRKYSLGGQQARETSLLFGLLRWRHVAGKGRQLLAPAFPGPGWPLDRVPSTLPALDETPMGPGVPR